jgi:alkylhydroperoxidase/carboxymuconolactone decarboxylase family protein YurZ
MIALGQTLLIRQHSLLALDNGVTMQELEELLYLSTAVTGYPAAFMARTAMREVFKEKGSI